MGGGCGSDHHKRPQGSFHFRDKIIRGCFVEGTLSLNWIKAWSNGAFQDAVSSCFIIVINIFFLQYSQAF